MFKISRAYCEDKQKLFSFHNVLLSEGKQGLARPGRSTNLHINGSHVGRVVLLVHGYNTLVHEVRFMIVRPEPFFQLTAKVKKKCLCTLGSIPRKSFVRNTALVLVLGSMLYECSIMHEQRGIVINLGILIRWFQIFATAHCQFG